MLTIVVPDVGRFVTPGLLVTNIVPVLGLLLVTCVLLEVGRIVKDDVPKLGRSVKCVGTGLGRFVLCVMLKVGLKVNCAVDRSL